MSDASARGAAAAPAAVAMRTLVALAAAHYTATIGFRITVALAAVAAGLSPASIGLVLSTFALVPMLLAVHGGRLVDRIGVRAPMLGGTALGMAGATLCAALPHPATLALATGLVGLGMMGFHLGMQHCAGEIGGPARRTANFNLLTMSFSVSGLVGPPLAGLVIDHAGHRAAFAGAAGLQLAVLLALGRFAFAPLLPPTSARRPLDEPGGDARPAAAAAFSLLGAPRLRRLLVASLLASAAWDVYQFVLPLHAGTIGLSATSVGVAIAAFSAGSLTVRLALPSLVSRMHPARWMQVALAVCVLAYAAAPWADGLGALLALSFLIGIGPGIAQPLLMAALHHASPPGRAGEAAGLRMTLLSAMQLVLPVALGVLGGVLGTAPLFWLYAALAAAIGIALARAERR
jgi:MFS family permease